MIVLKPSAEAPDNLFDEMERLIFSVVNRYWNYLKHHPAYDLDDLIQEGRLAVIEAAKTWDKLGGAAFSTWATLYIKRAVNRALGIRWRQGEGTVLPPLLASLDAPVDDAGEMFLSDLIADPAACEGWEGMAASQVQQEVREAVEQLPGDLHTIAKRHILGREPLALVAASLGLEGNQAITQKEKTLKALRKSLMPLYREYVLDIDTDWYKRKGIASFRRTHSSVVEDIAMDREGKGDSWRNMKHG